METEKIKFKKEQLANYSAINAPGKYELEVSSNVTEKNLVVDETTRRSHYIVGVKAIATDKLAQLKEVFKDATEVDIEQTNGLFLTGNIWATDSNIPMKGEKIEAIIDYVPSRTGEQVLRIKSMRVKSATKAGKLDLALLGAAEVTAQPSGQVLSHA